MHEQFRGHIHIHTAGSGGRGTVLSGPRGGRGSGCGYLDGYRDVFLLLDLAQRGQQVDGRIVFVADLVADGPEEVLHRIRRIDMNASKEGHGSRDRVRGYDVEHEVLNDIEHLDRELDHRVLRLVDLLDGGGQLGDDPLLLVVEGVLTEVREVRHLAAVLDVLVRSHGRSAGSPVLLPGLTDTRIVPKLPVGSDSYVGREEDEHIAIVGQVVHEGLESRLAGEGHACEASHLKALAPVAGEYSRHVVFIVVDLIRAHARGEEGIVLVEAVLVELVGNDLNDIRYDARAGEVIAHQDIDVAEHVHESLDVLPGRGALGDEPLRRIGHCAQCGDGRVIQERRALQSPQLVRRHVDVDASSGVVLGSAGSGSSDAHGIGLIFALINI